MTKSHNEDTDFKKSRPEGKPESDDPPGNPESPTAALASIEKYKAEPEIDANRYAEIALKSKVPLLRFLQVTMKEDMLFLLPRILMRTIRTMRRIPHTFFIKDEVELEHYVFQTIAQWSKSILKIAKMKLDIRGIEYIKPDQTYLFVSNHRSPADIPVLFATIPQPVAFVANAIFQKIPALSYWMRASGTVFIDQNNPKSALAAFKSMARRLSKGRSLVLFPEGHMHQGKGVDTFNRGGIFSAVLTGTPIVPICLYGTDKVIRPGSFHINPYKHVIVEVCAPIETTNLRRTEKKDIDAIVHDIIAEKRSFYEKRQPAPKKDSTQAASRILP